MKRCHFEQVANVQGAQLRADMDPDVNPPQVFVSCCAILQEHSSAYM